LIKGALIDPQQCTDEVYSIELIDNHTVEQAIKHVLSNFFEKRRASGDSRPCGKHPFIMCEFDLVAILMLYDLLY